MDIIISPIENFLEPPEVEKCPKKWSKLRNFESLNWLWKTRFVFFAGFLRLNFTSTIRTVIVWRILEHPGIGQPFKYIERYHVTHRKIFRATRSWKMFQKRTKTQKFRDSQFALKKRFGLLHVFWSSASLLSFVTPWFDVC